MPTVSAAGQPVTPGRREEGALLSGVLQDAPAPPLLPKWRRRVLLGGQQMSHRGGAPGVAQRAAPGRVREVGRRADRILAEAWDLN